jgi:hypothetical protein
VGAGEEFEIPFTVSNREVEKGSSAIVFGTIQFDDGEELGHVIFGRVYYEILPESSFHASVVSNTSALVPGLELKVVCHMDYKWLNGAQAEEILPEISSNFGEYSIESFEENLSATGDRIFTLIARHRARYVKLDDHIRIVFDLGPGRGKFIQAVDLKAQSAIVLSADRPGAEGESATVNIYLASSRSQDRTPVDPHGSSPSIPGELLGTFVISAEERQQFSLSQEVGTRLGILNIHFNPRRLSGHEGVRRTHLNFDFPNEGDEK